MKRSNEKALKIIEQQYKSFIDLQDNWGFFLGLAEYTKIIQKMTEIKPVIETLEVQRKLARKVYETMNTEAMNEFVQSANKLIPIAEKVLKEYEPIIKQTQEISVKLQPVMEAVQKVQDRLQGHILSSNPLSSFDHDLFDVARYLKASGHEQEIRPFINNEKENNNIYGNFTFSSTYEVISEEELILERKEQVEPWGAWGHLPLVERLVFEPEKLKDEYKAGFDKDSSSYWDYMNFIGVYVEMEKIRKGEKSDDDVIIFKVKDFKNYAQRVHSFIIKELIVDDSEVSELSFDDKKRTLNFMGACILISKKEESDSHKLIRTLFKDKYKIWANDEILEDWGYDFDEEVSDNKVYQAGRNVNKTIAEETKIRDFLIVSTKTVSINEKYSKI